jgi:hypothetical protein
MRNIAGSNALLSPLEVRYIIFSGRNGLMTRGFFPLAFAVVAICSCQTNGSDDRFARAERAFKRSSPWVLSQCMRLLLAKETRVLRSMLALHIACKPRHSGRKCSRRRYQNVGGLSVGVLQIGRKRRRRGSDYNAE